MVPFSPVSWSSEVQSLADTFYRISFLYMVKTLRNRLFVCDVFSRLLRNLHLPLQISVLHDKVILVLISLSTTQLRHVGRSIFFIFTVVRGVRSV
jgi:hypothetical protein